MPTALTSISGIGPAAAELLKQHGFKSAEAIAKATVEQLSAVPGFGEIRSKNTIKAASELVAPVAQAQAEEATEPVDEPVQEQTRKKSKSKDKKKSSKDKKSKGKKDKKKSKGKDKKKKDKKKGKKKKKK